MLRYYPRDGTRQHERTLFAQLRRYLAVRGSTTKHEVRWVRFPSTSAVKDLVRVCFHAVVVTPWSQNFGTPFQVV